MSSSLVSSSQTGSTAIMEESNNQQVLDTVVSIQEWLITEFRRGKKNCKTSEAKDKYPMIHMKWIELAFQKLEGDEWISMQQSSSRIKTYDINELKIPKQEVEEEVNSNKRSENPNRPRKRKSQKKSRVSIGT